MFMESPVLFLDFFDGSSTSLSSGSFSTATAHRSALWDAIFLYAGTKFTALGSALIAAHGAL